MRRDLGELKRSVNIINIIGRFVTLEKKGSEYRGICPFHNDTRPTLNVNETKQVWMCPTCGDDKKGDVIDFLFAMGNKLPKIIEILEGDGNSATPEKIQIAKVQKAPEWKHLRPKAECTSFTHYRHGQPKHIYPYRDEKGLIGYVCRFEFMDNGKLCKDTLPLIWGENEKTKVREWVYRGFEPRARPLYNTDLIVQNPDVPVIVVEGEKVADWLNERLKGMAIAVTWLGGSNQDEKTDFAILDGRKLLFWRDNDEPGLKCMTRIFNRINSDRKKWVPIPANAPKAWDAADTGWTAQQACDFIRRLLRDPIAKRHNEDETFFTYLGFEKQENQPIFVFYSKLSKTVFRMTAASMTKSSLMCLAPLQWWESHFDFKNCDQAAALLIGTSYQVGIYSPGKVRGRGAWYDDGRVVIHAGDRLIVDGNSIDLGDLDTNYIYEIGESFNFFTEHPLQADRATKLLEITKLLNWERNVSAYLLAGWCVIAPICGALRWRPHMWLTGPAASGKSWVFREIVRRLLGYVALDVQGVTTEAGIRQELGYDALAVVFDEIEGNDQRAANRVQDTVELARSASADNTGKIVKGSAAHKAKSFQIRSCFAFSSIAVGVDKGADRRRISMLSLVKPEDAAKRDERWKQLQALHAETLTEDFVMRLHARTIKLLPVILDNIKVFEAAVLKVLGNQAMADQLAPMLAGAYSLRSDGAIAYEKALEFVEAQDWYEEADVDAVKDEVELLKALFQWRVKVDGYGERQLAELINIAAGRVNIGPNNEENIPVMIANSAIKRLGVRVDNDMITFSNISKPITNELTGTRWAKGYSRILNRLPGANGTGTARFTSGPERCTKVPLSLID